LVHVLVLTGLFEV